MLHCFPCSTRSTLSASLPVFRRVRRWFWASGTPTCALKLRRSDTSAHESTHRVFLRTSSPNGSVTVKFARIGEPGEEVPVLVHGEHYYDMRSIAADIDGAFFAGGGIARAQRAFLEGALPEFQYGAACRICG